MREDWDDDELKSWGVDTMPFAEQDVQEDKEIYKDIEEDDVTDEDIQQAPERVRAGDIWQLGIHRLMCADSTNKENVEKLLNGEQADMWLTDPPYNVDYEGKTADKLKIANDKFHDDNAFLSFLVDAYNAAANVLKPGGVFYIWHADSEGYNFRKAAQGCGLKVRQCLIWNKNVMVMGRQDYQWKHEPCLYGWKDGAGHKWYSDRKQVTVIDYARPTASTDHPTMKPVGLFAYLIQNSSQEGDIVLDTFGGSGTTIIACEQLDRRGYSMELSPHYCDVILNRWEKLTGEKAVCLSNNNK